MKIKIRKVYNRHRREKIWSFALIVFYQSQKWTTPNELVALAIWIYKYIIFYCTQVEVQYSRAPVLEGRVPVQTSSSEDASNKLEQQKAKLAGLRQQRKSLSLNHQQCLSRHKSTQVLPCRLTGYDVTV